MTYSDIDLVNQIKENNDESALLELVDRHSGVFYKTVSEYIPHLSGNGVYDEFYGRREEFFYDAAKKFNENKGVKFSTWLVNSTRYKCLTERTRLKNEPEFFQFDQSLEESNEEEYNLTPDMYLMLKDDIKEVFDVVNENYDERSKDLLEKRFFGGKGGAGMTFPEIAETMNISTQAVQQAHSKLIKKLKKQFATQ